MKWKLPAWPDLKILLMGIGLIPFDLVGAWWNFAAALNRPASWMAPINMMVGVFMLYCAKYAFDVYRNHRKFMRSLEQSAQTYLLNHTVRRHVS